jgi:hypothetical protein
VGVVVTEPVNVCDKEIESDELSLWDVDFVIVCVGGVELAESEFANVLDSDDVAVVEGDCEFTQLKVSEYVCVHDADGLKLVDCDKVRV